MTGPDKQPLGIPTVMVVADTDRTGRVFFHPANVLAKNLLKLMRKTEFSNYDLEVIRDDLKFQIIHQNGLPVAIPHPKGAYQRKVEVAPRHVLDEA